MKDISVSESEFARYTNQQIEIQKEHRAELKEHRKELKQLHGEVKETNQLLREDIATTKAMVDNHIQAYNSDQDRNHETFAELDKRVDNVEKTIKDQESAYRVASIIKWAIVIVLTGALGASGKTLWDSITIKQPTQKVVK